MFVDDLKTARKICLGLLLGAIQLIIIASFGARWTSGNKWNLIAYTVSGISPPYSVLIPYPSYAPWWYGLTAILMYLVLVLCFLYIAWTIAQIALPDRIPFDLKMIVFIDLVFAGIVTIMLLFAYCFFAGGFGGTIFKGLGLGYCFWLSVVSSLITVAVVIISGISWFRN